MKEKKERIEILLQQKYTNATDNKYDKEERRTINDIWDRKVMTYVLGLKKY